MGKHARALAVMAATILLATGCVGRLFDVNLRIAGEQTSLEKQVLGSYSALGRDLLAYSSVRGVEPDGSLRVPPPATDSQKGVAAAMRNQLYNRDDIDLLLLAEVVGEGRDGMLAVRGAATQPIPFNSGQVNALVEEENADRAAIMERLMTTTPDVTEADRESVQWIVARLYRDSAPAGAWLQDRTGQWSRK